MQWTTAIAVALSLAFSGCSRRSTSASGQPPQPKPLPDAMTVAVNPKMAPVDPAIMRVDEEMLTFMAKHFARFKKRPPYSLEDLVKAHYLMRPPSPPPGMRYFVDTTLVCVTLTHE